MMPLKTYALNSAFFTVQPFPVNRPVAFHKHFPDAPALVQLFLHPAGPLPVRNRKARKSNQGSGPAVMPSVYRVPVKIANRFVLTQGISTLTGMYSSPAPKKMTLLLLFPANRMVVFRRLAIFISRYSPIQSRK